MRTRHLVQGKDNKWRVWVMMSARSLHMIDNSTIKYVRDLSFTYPIEVLVYVSDKKHEALEVYKSTEFPEEWGQ